MTHKLTAEMIEQAKRKVGHCSDIHYEHDDCIRMAYEWLDAQKKLKTKGRLFIPLKHVIQGWCLRYVSTSDVEVAAYLHPDIIGRYPKFNLSSKIIRPRMDRLSGINEAFKHVSTYGDGTYNSVYKIDEYISLPYRLCK